MRPSSWGNIQISICVVETGTRVSQDLDSLPVLVQLQSFYDGTNPYNVQAVLVRSGTAPQSLHLGFNRDDFFLNSVFIFIVLQLF